MNKCSDCGSKELRYYKHELCCSECGLVIDDFHLVTDHEYNTHSDVFNNYHLLENTGKTDKCIRTDKDHIRDILSILNRETYEDHDTVLRMMSDYEEKVGKGFKGKNRYLIAAICIFIVFEKYYDSQRFPVLLSLDRSLFLKELTKYKSTQNNKNNKGSGSIELEYRSKMNIFLFKQIAALKSSEESKQLIMKTSFRIYDKIEREIQLFSDFIIDKVSASIVWLAIKIAKNKNLKVNINLKLKEYCDCMCVSSATILKIQCRIKEVLLKTT